MSTLQKRVRLSRRAQGWSLLWDSLADQHLVGVTTHPSRTLLFETRAQARAYRDEHFGYIRRRPDLTDRKGRHGWRLPQVVKVDITVACHPSITRKTSCRPISKSLQPASTPAPPC